MDEEKMARTAQASQSTQTARTAQASQPPRRNDPFVRAPNEDDDGYDPYSDRPYEAPLFEPDPWD